VQSTGPTIPANLSEPCPQLPKLADPTQQETARWIVTASGLYADCREKHRRTIKAME